MIRKPQPAHAMAILDSDQFGWQFTLHQSTVLKVSGPESLSFDRYVMFAYAYMLKIKCLEL